MARYVSNITNIRSARRTRRPQSRQIVVRPRRGVPRLHRISPEIKYQNVQLLAAVGSSSGTGSIFNSFLPGQGNSANARIGDRCRCIGVELDLDFFMNVTATVAVPLVDDNAIRVIIGYSSNQAYGNAVSPALFEGDYFDASAGSDLVGAMKDLNTDIYTLHDKVYGINMVGSNTKRSDKCKSRVKCSVPLKFTPGSTILMQGSVFVWLACRTNAAFVTNQTCDVRGNVKFKFTDD